MSVTTTNPTACTPDHTTLVKSSYSAAIGAPVENGDMLQVVHAARAARLRDFYALQHRSRAGDYETWSYVAPIQKRAWQSHTFERGTWDGEMRHEFEPQAGDAVTQQHGCSMGFANTDLQLKVHGVHHLIIVGLIANTCIEATLRSATELSYEVTMVKDTTASRSKAEIHAAFEVNIPKYADAILTTREVVESIASLSETP